MADDSDLDEDELLQMALQEQAEREVSHGRPKSNVVNLVRGPPNPNSKARVATAPSADSSKPRKPNRGDDDDDSDVEMLSISSGDDEPQAAPVRGAAAQQRRGRQSREDYGGMEDGEPRSWKKVDEAELARRVREMREMKAMPVIMAVEQKAAVARKGLTSVQTLPRGVEVLDPLGLGVMDNKSLRIITDHSVSSPVSRERAESLDPDFREKVIYSSSDFDPKVFLSWVHQETSAADLEAGSKTLKAALQEKTQNKKTLVKENFDCFVSCKNTIDDIQSKLRQIEDDPDGAGTARLYEVTQKINDAANRAFQPLFERQAQADKIRSVQGMLQRFRTLFNLPSAIRGNIKKGEYDLAVREYQKAKSIVLPSHVGILKRVLEEVEKVMQEFRGMLYKSMEDPQLDLTELENIVRLLLELDPESDPVWHYLNIQNRRIRGLFEKCTLSHEAQMEHLQNKVRGKMQSDARWRQLQQESRKSLEADTLMNESLPVDLPPVNLMADEADTLRATYIHGLTTMLIQHVPAFWKLALSVFSGKFAKASAGNVVSDSDTVAKPAANKSDDKVEVKYSNHSLEEVAAMVLATTSVFETKVHNTFRDFEEVNILHPFMVNAITEIAKACQTLEGKDSCPPNAVRSLHSLHCEIAKIYILRICSWMRSTTKEISSNESWITLCTLRRNKSPYAISHMPIEFREMAISAMDRIDLMVQKLRNENLRTRDISDQLGEIEESVRLAFLNTFLDFAGYLEKFGGELSQSRANKENGHLQNGYFYDSNTELSLDKDTDGIRDPHKKLLIVLSNIGYCKAELSHELYDKYKHLWLADRNADEPSGDMRDLMTSFSALQEKVLEHYTVAKSNLIRDGVVNYLLDSGVQWGAAPAVKGIRDSTVDLLHILVAVHAELYAGAKPLLEKTMGILVEGLIDTFISVFRENKSKELKVLDTNGFCQLMLELEYFEAVLHTYFTPDAHQALQSFKDSLLEKASETAIDSSDNPGQQRKSTRGIEDAMGEDKQQGPTVSPDELLGLAAQCAAELLQGEMERTHLNIACFVEASLQRTSNPTPARSAYSSFQQSQVPISIASPSHRRQVTAGGSPAVSRRRR